MLVKLKLSNCDETVLIDDFAYEYFTNNAYLMKIGFLERLRKHSNGYAFFQKSWRQKDDSYKTETIYLHKKIAEQFLERPEDPKRCLVHIKNRNRLDCRTKNLEWCTHSEAARKRRAFGEINYKGVRREGKRYRSTIYVNNRQITIGTFDTPEEAALAYNKKSREIFGDTGRINIIRTG